MDIALIGSVVYILFYRSFVPTNEEKEENVPINILAVHRAVQRCGDRDSDPRRRAR